MQIIFLIVLFILGACFGSFLCCQARRLRLKETHKKLLGPRSVCLSCKKKLKWYDNIPVISWLILKGKCRNCNKKIGFAEFASEAGMGLAFLMLGTTVNITSANLQEWLIFIATLIFTIPLGFLAIYDGLYGELPVLILTISIICAIIIVSLKAWVLLSVDPSFSDFLTFLSILAVSVLILGGLYLLLYFISKGKWVGDGDWILAAAIAIALLHPWYALIELFLANFLAFIIMLPQVKKSKNHKIYFGPFLVIAFIITITFAGFLQSVL